MYNFGKNYSLSILKLLGIVLLVSGCVSGSQPREIFDLTAPSDFGISGSIDSQILIIQPKAVLALNTKNIAVVSKGNQISYFPNVAWSDDLANLVQTRIVEVFQNTNRVNGVGTPGQGMLADYRIVTEISEFQFSEDSISANVVFFVKIINERDGLVLASRKFSAGEELHSMAVETAVKGLNSALNKILIEIVNWSFIQLENFSPTVNTDTVNSPSS